MPGKTISAQLIQLKDIGIVEVVEPTGKTFLYRISERFFNLWLIMTQGGPAQKRSAKCWTIFLENWYDEQELKKLADEYVTGMGKKEYTGDHAALMAKALAHSKCISEIQRDLLIDNVLKLDDLSDEAKKSLPKLSRTVIEEAGKCIQAKNYKEALQILSGIEQNFETKYCIQAIAYYKLQMWQALLNINDVYPLKAFKDNDMRSSFALLLTASAVHLRNYSQGAEIGLNAMKKNWVKGNTLIDTRRVVYICCYYTPNQENKEQALNLLHSAGPDMAFSCFEILIELWNGAVIPYPRVKAEMARLKEDDFLSTFLSHLLIHFQYGHVVELFEEHELGLKGRELDAIYYAALKLQNTDSLATQKIPPEFEELVNGVVEEILDAQKRYYPELFKGK